MKMLPRSQKFYSHLIYNNERERERERENIVNSVTMERTQLILINCYEKPEKRHILFACVVRVRVRVRE